MQSINATEVRKNWSTICDDAVRNRPVFFKRTHDNMVIASNEDLNIILSGYKYHATLYKEDDGSVTIASDVLDLAENAEDKDSACMLLAEAILDYSEEYYSEFRLYSNAPNRRPHLPYVMKALLLGNAESIKGEMICRNGKI